MNKSDEKLDRIIDMIDKNVTDRETAWEIRALLRDYSYERYEEGARMVQEIYAPEHVPDRIESGSNIKAIVGKWPGNETDEEIERATKDLNPH